MSTKVTLILAVLLLGLVGFVFLYERPKMEEEQQVIEAKQAFIEMARHSVARLTLKNTHGSFVAEKRGNEWVLVEPLEAPAEWLEFEGMIEVAQIVERGRVIVGEEDYASADLANFGLAPPMIEMTFEPQYGEPIRLLFGDNIPSGQGCYLTWSGANKVVLTKKATRARFNLPLIELRDTRMFPFDPDLVTRASFDTPQGSYEVVRDGLKWHLVEPIKGRANQTEILKLLGQMKDERVVSFHRETVDDPTIYGFDNPDYKVVLHQKDVEEPWTLLLGRQVPDERQKLWYGRVLDRPQVFITEPFITEFLYIPLDALRYKQVFEFDRTGIDRVQLAYRDSILECKKVDGDSWAVTQGAIEGKKARGGDVIDRVHNLVVAEFVDQPGKPSDYGMDDPELKVLLWRGEELVQELVIGHADNRWYGKAKTFEEIVVLPYQVMSWLQLSLVADKKGA